MFKVYHRSGPIWTSFEDTWKRNRDTDLNNDRETRQSNDFYIRQHRLASYADHPYFSFPVLWNNIDNLNPNINFKNMINFGEFKAELKKHFLTNQ